MHNKPFGGRSPRPSTWIKGVGPQAGGRERKREGGGGERAGVELEPNFDSRFVG